MTTFLLGAVSAALVAGVVVAWRSPIREMDAYDLGRLHGTDDGLVRGYQAGWEAALGAPLTPDQLARLDDLIDSLLEGDPQ